MKFITLLLFVISSCVIVLGHGQEQDYVKRKRLFDDIFENIRSSTLAKVQAEAAIDVIYRLIPEAAHHFNVTINVLLPDNSFSVLKETDSKIVYITASSGVSACHGFYHYLKYYCNCQVAWEGTQINLPEVFPDVNIQMTAPSQLVYFQNVCTFSYSYVWWTFDQWRRHIDWIALHGITMTLAPFQEEVWTQLFIKFGIHRSEIDDYFAGPGFLSWQRMGNIKRWGGPLSSNFKNFSSTLQKRIVRSLRDLGITVVLPAFSGFVPRAFSRIYPNSSFTPAPRWRSFADEYCCPLFLDPSDPLYSLIGKEFLNSIIKAYGTDHIYFADPFNENHPRYADASYLGNTSLAMYETMKLVDPQAVWLLQGWMFTDTLFWTDDLIEAFLTAVPQGRILVLDLMSELLPQYGRTKSFYGQPFIWCMLHNFGGTLGMHGSAEVVYNRLNEARKNKNLTMVGVGITPEGINQNHVMYEFALELGWNPNLPDPESWFKQYATARYGGYNRHAEKAWELLYRSVYSYHGNLKLHGKYTISQRPSLKIEPWTWYRPSYIEEALSQLLEMSDYISSEKALLYQHDVVDVSRQLLQNRADRLYLGVKKTFEHKDKNRMVNISSDFLDLLLDMDRVLKTSQKFLLGVWLATAKRLGRNALEKKMYEMNARTQITLWGPDGEITDYANKQWSGVIADYYYKRWSMFFSELESVLQNNMTLDEKKLSQNIKKWVEEPFTMDKKVYPVKKEGDTIEIAKEILEKYTDDPIIVSTNSSETAEEYFLPHVKFLFATTNLTYHDIAAYPDNVTTKEVLRVP